MVDLVDVVPSTGPSANIPTLTQSFAVTAGNTYDVSFCAVSRDGTLGVATLSVSTGTAAFTPGTSGANTAPGWLHPLTTGDGTLHNPLIGYMKGGTSTWLNDTFSFVPSASGTATLGFGTTRREQANILIPSVSRQHLNQAHLYC